MTTPPPPTVLAHIDAPQAIVDRLTNLWRLATTDDQRWEIERLAEELGLVIGTWLEAQEEIDWDWLADEASTAAAEAAHEVIRDHAPAKPKAVRS